MLTTAQVDIPQAVRAQLRERAAFSESWAAFTREHLAGFKQPVAAAVAVIGPVLIAFVYAASDFFTMLEVASVFAMTSALFVLGAWYVNRRDILSAFGRAGRERRQAITDLKDGKAEEVALDHKERPVFYEHEHGVIALADGGAGRTLFFDVDGDGTDARWFLYLNGDMHRQGWRWLRLQGTGAVTEFTATGKRLAGLGDTPYVEAPDAWEAISLALGEPRDGEMIDMPFAEVKQTVARLI